MNQIEVNYFLGSLCQSWTKEDDWKRFVLKFQFNSNQFSSLQCEPLLLDCKPCFPIKDNIFPELLPQCNSFMVVNLNSDSQLTAVLNFSVATLPITRKQVAHIAWDFELVISDLTKYKILTTIHNKIKKRWSTPNQAHWEGWSVTSKYFEFTNCFNCGF